MSGPYLSALPNNGKNRYGIYLCKNWSGQFFSPTTVAMVNIWNNDSQQQIVIRPKKSPPPLTSSLKGRRPLSFFLLFSSPQNKKSDKAIQAKKRRPHTHTQQQQKACNKDILQPVRRGNSNRKTLCDRKLGCRREIGGGEKNRKKGPLLGFFIGEHTNMETLAVTGHFRGKFYLFSLIH